MKGNPMSVNLMLPVTKFKVTELGDGRQQLELSAVDPATGETVVAFIAGGDLYLLCPEGVRTDWTQEASFMAEFVPRDGDKRTT
jgi:hypothetical protein